MFSIRAPGTAALIASTTCPDSASPHNAATAASAATPGAASTCASADGTALIRDPRHGPAPPRSASASRFGTTSRQPPEHSVPNTSNTDTSKLSDVDPSTRDNSPPGNAEAAQHASDTTPACSTTTPFGRPVDPDVYTTYATSPGTPATGRSSPPGPPARTPATPASSSTSTRSPPRRPAPAATAPVVSTATGPDSASMNPIRSPGYPGSTGTYPAPDFSTPSTAVIMAGERGIAIATSRPGPAPKPTRCRASR